VVVVHSVRLSVYLDPENHAWLSGQHASVRDMGVAVNAMVTTGRLAEAGRDGLLACPSGEHSREDMLRHIAAAVLDTDFSEFLARVNTGACPVCHDEAIDAVADPVVRAVASAIAAYRNIDNAGTGPGPTMRIGTDIELAVVAVAAARQHLASGDQNG
jgi:hypothetical protein